MLVVQAIGLFLAVYLALLARSAWKQGELRQFLVSLGAVAGMIALAAAVIALYSRFD